VLVGYLGLFLAAFGAATLLPLQSEAVLVGLLVSGHYSLWLLLGSPRSAMCWAQG
jgi:membrane protein YqaA with SNARE-associated domain